MSIPVVGLLDDFAHELGERVVSNIEPRLAQIVMSGQSMRDVIKSTVTAECLRLFADRIGAQDGGEA